MTSFKFEVQKNFAPKKTKFHLRIVSLLTSPWYPFCCCCVCFKNILNASSKQSRLLWSVWRGFTHFLDVEWEQAKAAASSNQDSNPEPIFGSYETSVV